MTSAERLSVVLPPLPNVNAPLESIEMVKLEFKSCALLGCDPILLPHVAPAVALAETVSNLVLSSPSPVPGVNPP